MIRVQYVDAYGVPFDMTAPTDNPILAAAWLQRLAETITKDAVLTPGWGNPPSGLWPKAPETPGLGVQNGGIWPAVQAAEEEKPPTWNARWDDNFKDTV